MCGDWITRNHHPSSIFTGNIKLYIVSQPTKLSYIYSFVSFFLFVFILQYIPHMMKGDKPLFDRFAVLFSVAIVWLYAYLLTVGGAYKNSAPKTQITCRTDRAGIIGGASW
jgi:hypothetical protein